MSGGFIDIARGRLNLAAEQLDFIRGGAVGSFDELHAVLRASPSLANEAWLAAGKLLALMENEGLLSARYLERLKAPPVVLPPPAAAAPRRPEPRVWG
ncbi:hypothetical protein, partial [Roseomonas rosulenta]|uniref:hypothetical protein n=1 Tax=Roseomonas rosulenta TaxID=2748667 RepID=UPI0018DFA833